jgi:Protein of unknown function (DUF3306)
MGREGVLSRWSRRKTQARQGMSEPAPSHVAEASAVAATLPDASAAAQRGGRSAEAVSTPGANAVASMPAAPAVPNAGTASPAPTLDDVARLPADASDFSRFVAHDVQPEVKHAALKKLFSDPHFNLMDGLDVYIDDYGKPDPLPAAMLQQMAGSRFLGLLIEEPATPPPTAGTAPAAPPNTDNGASAAVEATPHAVATGPESLPDEDTDLRLQPDDAARREGVAAGPGEEPGASH